MTHMSFIWLEGSLGDAHLPSFHAGFPICPGGPDLPNRWFFGHPESPLGGDFETPLDVSKVHTGFGRSAPESVAGRSGPAIVGCGESLQPAARRIQRILEGREQTKNKVPDGYQTLLPGHFLPLAAP